MKTLTLLCMLCIGLAGCQDTQRTPGAFDVPVALSVLPADGRTPFTQSIGYAANADGGRISVLALDSGTFLSDTEDSILRRGNGLAAGENRRIAAMSTWVRPDGGVDLLVADKSFGQVLRIPHVTRFTEDGVPLRAEPTHTAPVFTDADDSGDSARLEGFGLYDGAVSTEDWEIRYDGAAWQVIGTRSGQLPVLAQTGVAYTWDRPDDFVGARLRPPFTFTITGSATAGDLFTLRTDNGLQEADVGGTPLHMALSGDGQTLALSVSGEEEALLLAQPGSLQNNQTVSLAADSTPGRLTWHENVLYAADNTRSAFWSITPDGVATEHLLPFPSVDVAVLRSTDGGLWAYVVPTSADAVWLYDLEAGELQDINPWVPGVQGLDMAAQVRGVGAIDQPFSWPQQDNGGVSLFGKAVAVSLANGVLHFAEESTGCLLRDVSGPRTLPQSSFGSGGDIQTNFASVPGGATLQGNGTNARAVQVNPCGGVAWTESWRVRYDQTVQAWRVEGSLSGVQETLAYENMRYISDKGQVSFLIRSGATPSVDGWLIEFSVTDGLVRADGDDNLDSRNEVPLDLPGDPIGFAGLPPITPDAGWELAEPIPYVLVAAEAADLVARVNPRFGTTLAWW